MSVRSQIQNFIRVLIKGAPDSGPRPKASSTLAKTARDLKIVNMSVEDDRLGDPGRNQAYQDSLDS